MPRLKVFINSSYDGNGEMELMAKCGFDRAKNMDDADAIFFVGGSDINPLLYGEEPLRNTFFDQEADDRDLIGWRNGRGKLKIGVCRGGQFLNVMNGGKLWQDVDGHRGRHKIRDLFTRQEIMVSSTHHQMFRPAPGAITIAVANESSQKLAENLYWQANGKDGLSKNNFFKIDHEVLWYPQTQSLCFQPHPEYSTPHETGPYFATVLEKCRKNQYPVNNDGLRALIAGSQGE